MRSKQRSRWSENDAPSGRARCRGNFEVREYWVQAGDGAWHRTYVSAVSAPPTAERPTYAVGEEWIRDDGTYRLIRADDDRYVFSAGPGREGVSPRRRRLRVTPPPRMAWPLEVGRWGTDTSVRRTGGNPAGTRVVVTWRVEKVEDVRVGNVTLSAFRIRVDQRFPTGRETPLTMCAGASGGAASRRVTSRRSRTVLVSAVRAT